MMLAMALEGNFPKHDHIIVAAGFFESFAQYVLRILRISGEVLFKCPGHSGGRLKQTVTGGIVARPADDGPEGRLDIRARGAASDEWDRLLVIMQGLYKCVHGLLTAVPFYAESEQTDLDPDIGLLPDPPHWDLFDRVLFRMHRCGPA